MHKDPTPALSFAEQWQRSQEPASRPEPSALKASTVPDDAAPPARCPACRSQVVTTTSKVASADAYWRCGKCGEVWNIGRHRAGSRYAPDLPFRR